MPSTRTTFMAAAMAFAFTANAHMKLHTPTPYGNSTLQNGPLDPSGKDFPCKQRPGVYDAEGASNVMPIGVNQTLSFFGGATHGGGSCQISLSKDKQPTAQSKWMVIYSIEGGCPSSVDGNVSGDPKGTSAATFQYSIPQGIAPGDYTLAWTWFNKIGNREMYMNCAPVTVTGGSKKRDEQEITERDTSFPDMFVANIPATDCTTQEGGDLAFPNPGSANLEQSAKKLPPTGPKCGAAAAGSGSSGSTSGASAPQPSSSGGVFAAGASSVSAAPAPSSAPAVAPPVASAASSGASAPAVAPGNTSSSSSSGSAPAAAPAPATGGAGSAPAAAAAPGSSSCSSPGTEVCSPDGAQIGMCDSTSHVVFQPVAGGTKCVGGQMVVAGSGKRSAKFIGRDRVRRSSNTGAWGFHYGN